MFFACIKYIQTINTYATIHVLFKRYPSEARLCRSHRVLEAFSGDAEPYCVEADGDVVRSVQADCGIHASGLAAFARQCGSHWVRRGRVVWFVRLAETEENGERHPRVSVLQERECDADQRLVGDGLKCQGFRRFLFPSSNRGKPGNHGNEQLQLCESIIQNYTFYEYFIFIFL